MQLVISFVFLTPPSSNPVSCFYTSMNSILTLLQIAVAIVSSVVAWMIDSVSWTRSENTSHRWAVITELAIVFTATLNLAETWVMIPKVSRPGPAVICGQRSARICRSHWTTEPLMNSSQIHSSLKVLWATRATLPLLVTLLLPVSGNRWQTLQSTSPA